MQSYRKLPYKAKVQGLFSCEDSVKSIVSKSVDYIDLGFEGIPGDTHSGVTREACGRFTNLYEEGATISNSRQLSIVSSEELREIAKKMEIEEVLPTWLGANLELTGIPSLTLLPPASRLVFPSKATLIIDIENQPCVYPAQIINQHYPGKGRKFVRNAMHLRGVTARVERPGRINPGDKVKVFFPAQDIHPDFVPVKAGAA